MCSSPYINLLITKLISISVTAHSDSISKSCPSCLATFVIRFLLDRVSNRRRWNSYYLNNLNIKGASAEMGSAPAAGGPAPRRAQPLRAHPGDGGDPRASRLGGSPPRAPTVPGAGGGPQRTSLLPPEAQAEPLPRWASFQSPGLSLRGGKNRGAFAGSSVRPFSSHPAARPPRHGAGRGRGVPNGTHAPLQGS